MNNSAVETKNSSQVRVRFAPSPTGDFHVGSARTALFNYLYARHTGGKFLLRIEDTDRERSTDHATRVIMEGLAWLGLSPDEPIVYQGARVEEHRKAAYAMLARGQAYRAFESAEELASARELATANKQAYKYNRASLYLSPSDVQARLDRGEPFAIRLKVPEGEVRFKDGVHNEIRVACEEIEDLIILRSDGTPTYNLAVVVDDAFMGVTHVIRGDDHISNTPKQILMYRALGLTEPQFAHVPLILGTDKKKLSKRHGATSILWYRDNGFLPETMINFFGLLGWSPGDDRNIINMEELIQLFDISGIMPNSAVFDNVKLGWLNGQYISLTPYSAVANELAVYANQAVTEGKLATVPSPAAIETAWELLKSRLHYTMDLFTNGLYFFTDPVEYDPKGAEKHFTGGAISRLTALADDYSTVEPFTAESCEAIVRQRAEEWGTKGGDLIHPLRLAVSGTSVGPGLFELLEVLGKDTVVRRIRTAIKHIAG